MVTAVYPGTFDPITKGHHDIAVRAAGIFDKVLFAVADGSGKPALFDQGERTALAEEILAGLNNVEVVSFSGLVTDFARANNAKVIIRGIRAVFDFDYEFQMAGMNRELLPATETVFLSPSAGLHCISSSLVREISACGGDVSHFVHDAVAAALKKKQR